jgi:hypothetical protein
MTRVKIALSLSVLVAVTGAGLWWLWSNQYSNWEAKAYPIQDVTRVDAAGGCIMTITQGDKDALLVQGRPESLERIRVDQTGDLLTLRLSSFTRDISWRNVANLHNDNYRYVLQLKNLQQLTLDDACVVDVGDWRGDSLEVYADQASKVDFDNLTLNHFSIEQRQASLSRFKTLTAASGKFHATHASYVDVDEHSEVGSIDLKVGHASHFDGKLLRAQRAHIDADRASSVDISVVQELDVTASYASDVNYWGAPKAKVETIKASNVNAHAAKKLN